MAVINVNCSTPAEPQDTLIAQDAYSSALPVAGGLHVFGELNGELKVNLFKH